MRRNRRAPRSIVAPSLDTPDSIRFALGRPVPASNLRWDQSESACVSDGSYLLYQAMPVIHQWQHFVSGENRRVTVGPDLLSAAGSQFSRFPQGSRMQRPRPSPWTTQGREQDLYALIRQYNGLDTETQESATRKANAELRPILAKSPGFVSFELIKPEDKQDVVASISVFKTRVDAEASSKVAEDWVHTNLPSMTKPSKLAGELVAH